MKAGVGALSLQIENQRKQLESQLLRVLAAEPELRRTTDQLLGELDLLIGQAEAEDMPHLSACLEQCMELLHATSAHLEKQAILPALRRATAAASAVRKLRFKLRLRPRNV